MKSTALKSTRLVVALLTAGAIGGAGVGAFNSMQVKAAAVQTPTGVSSSVAALPMALPDFSQITERYGPAVVNISVTGSTKVSDESQMSQGDGGPLSNDPSLNFSAAFSRVSDREMGQTSSRKFPPTVRAQASSSVATASS